MDKFNILSYSFDIFLSKIFIKNAQKVLTIKIIFVIIYLTEDVFFRMPAAQAADKNILKMPSGVF